ncbi:hypothetical protein Tco_0712563 [Tanacetum coccineum]
MFVEFVIQNQYFSPSLEDFAQILRIPCEGACVFSDRWSLDELVYGAPSEGPYQTNLPSPDDIISLFEKTEKVKSLSSIIKKKLRAKTQKGSWHEKRSSIHFLLHLRSTESSSHLNDDDDGNDEGTSRASTPSPICYVNSLTNQVP